MTPAEVLEAVRGASAALQEAAARDVYRELAPVRAELQRWALAYAGHVEQRNNVACGQMEPRLMQLCEAAHAAAQAVTPPAPAVTVPSTEQPQGPEQWGPEQ